VTVRSAQLGILHSSVLNTSQTIYTAPASGFRVIVKDVELATTGAHRVEMRYFGATTFTEMIWHVWNSDTGTTSQRSEHWLVMELGALLIVRHDGGTIDAIVSGTVLAL